MISPELEMYEFLDDKGFPYEDFYEPQRIPKQKDPNFISPRPGCFGQGIVFLVYLFWFHFSNSAMYLFTERELLMDFFLVDDKVFWRRIKICS